MMLGAGKYRTYRPRQLAQDLELDVFAGQGSDACRREIEMSYPERSRSVRFGPAVPDSHVSVGHPLGVAPERVSKAEATDGSVRDRQKAFDSLVGGLFHFAITAVSSRAERPWT